MDFQINVSVKKLLQHKFFQRLSSDSINIEMVKIAMTQYYCASMAFPGFLGTSLQSLSGESAQFVIVKNLWDEYGMGNENNFHRGMLRRFLEACGCDVPTRLSASPYTKAYIRGMNSLCSFGSEGEILGALGPGCEYFTPAEYRILLNSFQRMNIFSERDLEFFFDHIDHDGDHISDFKSAIDDYVKNNGSAEVVSGALQAISYEFLFWDGVESSLEFLSI